MTLRSSPIVCRILIASKKQSWRENGAGLQRIWKLGRLGITAVGASASELRVQWHRVMTTVLALQPTLDSHCHRTKFVLDSAVGTADDRCSSVCHFKLEAHRRLPGRPSRTIASTVGSTPFS